jgi:hypothetical protein
MDFWHRVRGLTLPPCDANPFHHCLCLEHGLGEEINFVEIVEPSDT